MGNVAIGEKIDGVSAELHGLSLLCERLAEELTGKPGPRSQNNKEGQPNSLQQLKAEIAALLRWDKDTIGPSDSFRLHEFRNKLRQLSAV